MKFNAFGEAAFPLILSNSTSATSVAADLLEFVLLQPFANHARRTPNSGINYYCIDRAVDGAGSTLHAGILICQRGFSIVDEEHLVRAHLNTTATAYARRLVELQSDNIF